MVWERDGKGKRKKDRERRGERRCVKDCECEVLYNSQTLDGMPKKKHCQNTDMLMCIYSDSISSQASTERPEML